MFKIFRRSADDPESPVFPLMPYDEDDWIGYPGDIPDSWRQPTPSDVITKEIHIIRRLMYIQTLQQIGWTTQAHEAMRSLKKELEDVSA